MPEESTAVDFYQLFIDNRIIGKIVRETNTYAHQSFQAANKDVSLWTEVTLQGILWPFACYEYALPSIYS